MNDAIERLAHTLWEKAGQPEGRDLEFWLVAEQLVHADEQRATHPKADAADLTDTPNPAAIIGGD